MNRKPTFFTSDWHIGHENVLKFSNRPFRDLNHMHESLIKRYNSSVPENGICYFLGDMGVSTALIKSVLSQLNGTKVLLLGNHDKGTNAMYNAGFDVVINTASLVIANEIVTMSHCPMLGKYREDTTGMVGGTPGEPWHGSTRMRMQLFTIAEHESFHLQGHTHAPNGGRSKRIEGKQRDVGVDANNYGPVPMRVLESWITTYKGN